MFLISKPDRSPTREDRRLASREECAVPITLRESGRSPDIATITELSEQGCTIEGGLVLGGRFNSIELAMPGSIEARAEFVWSNGQRTGLKFTQPMTGDTLDFLLRITANDDEKSEGDHLPRREKIRLGYAEEPLLRRKKSTGNHELSSLISREVERSCNHRAEARFPIEYATAPSTIEHAGKALPLVNISPSGLGIGADLGQEIGEAVELRFADCDAIEGHIAWKTANCTGIALEDDAICLTREAED